MHKKKYELWQGVTSYYERNLQRKSKNKKPSESKRTWATDSSEFYRKTDPQTRQLKHWLASWYRLKESIATQSVNKRMLGG